MTNQKGFSLIELMMVVVIMGVLAGVGIPQYQKFQMKAKQSEVKALLSGMYTAQKAFYAEWNQYYADFNAVGYGLDGNLGYYVAFATQGVNGPSTHPNPIYRRGPRVFNATSFCNTRVNGQPQCNISKARTRTPVGGTTARISTFAFGGSANIDNDATLDQWRIDQNRQFTQVRDDIAN